MKKVVFLVLIFINVIYVWSGATKFGAHSVDVYANWLLKAKVLYQNNGVIPRKIMDNPEYKSAHWQYPLYLPFSIYHLYNIFGFNENIVYRIYPFIYTLILVLAYKNIRSLPLVYVYSMVGPLLAQGGRYHAGNADIWITLLGWLIVSFRQKKWLVALLVIVASMIKTEGVFWVVFLLDSPWLWLAVTPTIVWQILIKKYNLPSDFWMQFNPNIWGLLRGVLEEFLKIKNWYIIWPIFFLSMKKHPLWKPLLMMLGGFGFIYLGTNIDTYAYVNSSFDRVLLQLSPLWLMIWARSLVR